MAKKFKVYEEKAKVVTDTMERMHEYLTKMCQTHGDKTTAPPEDDDVVAESDSVSSEEEEEEEEAPSTIEDLSKWINGSNEKYKEFKLPFGKGTVTVMLRNSTVPRLDQKQFDIVRIETSPRRQGIGSEFVKLLSSLAAQASPSRGVYLEAARSVGGKKFAESLVKNQGFEQYQPELGDPDNYIRRLQ